MENPVIQGRGIPINFNDFLDIGINNSAVDVGITVFIKTVLADGSVQNHRHDLTPTTDGTDSGITVRLDGGWLIQVTLMVREGVPEYGDTFAFCRLHFGSSTASLGFQFLASGYITELLAVSWPDMVPRDPLLPHKGIVLIAGTSPAAGANYTYTVGVRQLIEVISVGFRLVTAATVATRTVTLFFDDSSIPVNEIVAANDQVASLTVDYFFSVSGVAETLKAGIQMIPMAKHILKQTHRMRIVVTNIQATDAISRIRIEAGKYVNFGE